MFDTWYTTSLVDIKVSPEEDVLCTWKYNFRASHRRYVAIVEQYKYNIYVIKFHATSHKAKTKYNLLTGNEQAAPIIRTCINLMLDVYAKNPDASFGIIGAHSTNKKRKGKTIIESRNNTQRYRIYKTLMLTYFGQENFSHNRSAKYSTYLLINRGVGGIRLYKSKAEKMFTRMYDGLTL